MLTISAGLILFGGLHLTVARRRSLESLWREPRCHEQKAVYAPISIPEQLFEPVAKREKSRILFMIYQMPEIHLESLTLANKLVEIFGANDGEFWFV